MKVCPAHPTMQKKDAVRDPFRSLPLHSQAYTSFNLFAVKPQINVNVTITPTIPNHQPSPVDSLPGTGTFMPNNPAIRFSGTKIVAKTVILPNRAFARDPCSICAKLICER